MRSATSIDARGDNRAISCCPRLCHLARHRAAGGKFPRWREIAYGSAVLAGHSGGQGTGGGDPPF